MKTLIALVLAACVGLAHAEDPSLNVYSSRHYQSDEALYAAFTKSTGIRVNRIEAKEDALIERVRNEGSHSPADVLITTDAGRLWRAQQLGLFQTVRSPVLDARIPANFRDPEGQWYGFSLRARVIVYNKAKVKPEEISTYASLAEPKWKGRICVRSGTHVYNLSLMGALIEHLGKEKAEAWAKAVKANLAREPKGGDTDQMRGVAAGEVIDQSRSARPQHRRQAFTHRGEVGPVLHFAAQLDAGRRDRVHRSQVAVVDGERVHGGITGEDRARPVAVMQIQVDDQDRWPESGGAPLRDRHRHVVEGAEAAAARPFRMMEAAAEVHRDAAGVAGELRCVQGAAAHQPLHGQEAVLVLGFHRRAENRCQRPGVLEGVQVGGIVDEGQTLEGDRPRPPQHAAA